MRVGVGVTRGRGMEIERRQALFLLLGGNKSQKYVRVCRNCILKE